MAQGFETDVAIHEQIQGWGSTGSYTSLGMSFAEIDSFAPDSGVVQTSRNSKLSGNKSPNAGLTTNDFENPAGNITWQPRPVELLPILMSHYNAIEAASQAIATGTVTATFRFSPSAASPDAVGSTWGTFKTTAASGGGGAAFTNTPGDIYPLRVHYYFGTLSEMAPEGQFVFNNGYVDSISFNQPFDGDLVFTANFRHKGNAPGIANFPGTGNPGTNFVSGELRFAGWTATITLDGTANSNLDIENVRFDSRVNGQGRGRLGQYGFGRFNQTGDEYVWGLDLEFKDALTHKKVLSGSVFAIDLQWTLAGQAGWVRLNTPNCKFRPSNPSVTAGDQPVNITYEAAAFATNGTPAVIWSVYTAYGTQMFSMHK